METQAGIQGVFDFESGNSNGFQNWRREQERRLEAVRREWGLPVGRRVRLRLRDVDGEFEGKLELVHHPVTCDSRVALHLRIERMDFTSTDVEQCIRLS